MDKQLQEEYNRLRAEGMSPERAEQQARFNIARMSDPVEPPQSQVSESSALDRFLAARSALPAQNRPARVLQGGERDGTFFAPEAVESPAAFAAAALPLALGGALIGGAAPLGPSGGSVAAERAVMRMMHGPRVAQSVPAPTPQVLGPLASRATAALGGGLRGAGRIAGSLLRPAGGTALALEGARRLGLFDNLN